MEDMEVPRGVGKILVINDEPSVSIDTAKWLTNTGYRYVFVDNVEKAKDALEKEEFDLVIFGHEFLFFRKYLEAR